MDVLDFKDKLILAPMAGVTDRSFRKLCIEQGADYTVSEMISAKALCYRDKKTAVLAKISKEEMPIALQIFGSDPEIMASAARMLSRGEYEGCTSDCVPAAIDVNMGCPVHKIVSNGEGSALMKDPVRAGEILRAVCEASSVPVTVKIRAGYDRAHINAPEIAAIAEKAGAAAICVHARTREQMYRPGILPEVIRAVKKSVSLPVIGNGDIFTARDAMNMRNETHCDGWMLGRGACGNPFVFAEIKAALSGKEGYTVTPKMRLLTARRHLFLLYEDKGTYTGLMEARKHIAWYIKGIQGAPALRDRVNRITDPDEMAHLLDELIEVQE